MKPNPAIAEAYQRKGQAIADAKDARRTALSNGTSFWLCPPDKFYEEARKRAAELNAVTTSYTQPWGMV